MKKILGQSSLVSLAKFVEKVLSFTVVVLASRKLGNEGVGQFFYYFSITSLFIPLMDLGFEKLYLQEWSRLDDNKRTKMLSTLTLLKLLSGSLALLLIIVVDSIVRGEASNFYAIIASFLAIYLEQFGMLLRSPDRALYRVRLEIVVPVVSRSITVILLCYYINDMEAGYQLCYVYLASNLLGFFISLKGLNNIRPSDFSEVSHATFKNLFIRGLPFSFTSLFVMLSLYVDSVILGHFNIGEVGYYNAAYRILLVFGLLSGGVCHVFFPRIIKWYREGKTDILSEVMRFLVQGFFFIFGSVVAGCYFFGKQFMITLYGPSFEKAGEIFVYLSPLVLLLSFTNLFGHTLEAMQFQKKTMAVCMFASLFNLLANLIIIPKYGMYGAATTTMLTEVVSLALYLWLMFKTISNPFSSHFFLQFICYLLLLSYGYYTLSVFTFLPAIIAALFLTLLLLIYPLKKIWLQQYTNFILEGDLEA